MKYKDYDPKSQKTSFIDCGEGIKVEYIKEEINEEESVDDPLSIQGETTTGESENIVLEVKKKQLMMILSMFRRYINLEMERTTQLLMI